jgi:hypothetical protein
MVTTSVQIPPDYGKGTNGKSLADRRRREALFKAQQGKCHWCWTIMELNHFRVTAYGRTKDNPSFASFEHLLPKAKGGWNHPKNIVLAHASCNNARERRKWPHDPIYGKGEPLQLPPKPINGPYAKKKRNYPPIVHKERARREQERSLVFRGGFWLER